MQIVIPMSGFGERFKQAGYTLPKPLIEVEDKPIIAHVIDLFPSETDFLFVCRQDHLNNKTYQMEKTILRYCPTARIVGINSHKRGPVYTVMQAAEYIDPTKPVIVNYCDFACYWDWADFKKFVATNKCDGAIPAYKGFHPHMLNNTNYAYIREEGGWVLDIQEKQPYTDQHMDEYASSGTYYFIDGQTMFKAFHDAIEQGLQVNGEHYISLAYKPLLAEERQIAVYEIQHFMQWGTPEDLSEYIYWSNSFRYLVEPQASGQVHTGGTVIVPMAGLGQRFAQEGYTTTKPMIPISGLSMVAQATKDLPKADKYVFILRKDMPCYKDIANELEVSFPSVQIVELDSVTEGQACTASMGLAAAQEATEIVSEPITFGACDNGTLYDAEGFLALINDPATDVVVWAIRGYPNAARKPKMFGWIDAMNNKIKQISVKVPLEDPTKDPITLGTFTFKRARDFNNCMERMISRDGKINGEYYIDTCINDALALGLRCRVFEVDSFLCWGTPDDLRTFEYWQSCFHKWGGHPYSLDNDSRVPAGSMSKLNELYRAWSPSSTKET